MAFRAWVLARMSWMRIVWYSIVISSATLYGAHRGWELSGFKGATEYGLLFFFLSPLLTSPEVLMFLLSF